MTDNSTLADEINLMIDSKINEIPTPMRCKITKVYDDNNHVDITSDLGDLEYIETIGATPTVNKKGILIFLNNDPSDMMVIQ